MLIPLLGTTLSKLFFLGQWVRGKLYDSGILPIHRFSVPIISVGNLSVGGTGKTPIISFLISEFEKSGVRVGVVSRGYRGRFTGVAKVDWQSQEFYFGDEPTMLAKKFPNVPVYVCPDRVLAVKTLLEKEQVDCVLADDAFQHRRLGRALDLVIIDCSEPIESYQLVPKGRLREPIPAMKRAHAVIFNKVNLIDVAHFQESAVYQLAVDLGLDIFWSKYAIKDIVRIDNFAMLDVRPQKCILVSGIGRPQSFTQMMESEGWEVIHHFSFRDHHDFSHEDVLQIINKYEDLGRPPIFCTEKDAVKLAKYRQLHDLVSVVRLNLKVEGDQESLVNRINDLIQINSTGV